MCDTDVLHEVFYGQEVSLVCVLCLHAAIGPAVTNPVTYNEGNSVCFDPS